MKKYIVYRMSVDDNQLPLTPFIYGENLMFHYISINTLNDNIYITDDKTYTQNRDVLIFSSDITLKKTFEVGICPNYILFNTKIY